MYCRPPQRRSMTIRMALIVSVVLAMLTGGCFRTTPTSTGVLGRSLDPDLWPWITERNGASMNWSKGATSGSPGPTSG